MKSIVKGTKSWETTLAGVIQFIVVAGQQVMFLFDDPSLGTEPNWGIVVGSAAVAMGFVVSRDNNKRSENVGA